MFKKNLLKHNKKRGNLATIRKKFTSINLTKKTVANCIFFLIMSYFIFHSIYGSRGIIEYFKLQAELDRSHIKLENLRSERLEIENRAKLLRPGSLDKDMLDEKARNVLGLSKPNEKVFRIEELKLEKN
jgi:cell division protein FtsB